MESKFSDHGVDAGAALAADTPTIEDPITSKDVAKDNNLDFLRFIPVPFSIFWI
jgi:hypothetical protein